MRKVYICIPSLDQWAMPFGLSLANMLPTFQASDAVCHFKVHVGRDSLLDRNRELLAEEAIRDGATDILWLDTDMRFPADALNQLLARDTPIVAANYMRKTIPSSPVSVKDGEGVWTGKDSTGVEEVDFTGFGVCLIKTEVFNALPKPWFLTGYSAKGNYHIGEDVYFFRKCRDAGYNVLVDHDLSKSVSHVGTFEYSPDLGWAQEGLV